MNCDADYVYYTGDGESGDLSKVQFGLITEDNLVYNEGKNDHFVFEGTIVCCGAQWILY